MFMLGQSDVPFETKVEPQTATATTAAVKLLNKVQFTLWKDFNKTQSTMNKTWTICFCGFFIPN